MIYMSASITPILVIGSASAWTPGTYPAPSRNLTVDTQSRNDVLAFWHGVYRASDNFESSMGWTGSYATTAGAQGTNSATFIANTERRLNYFRAMAGVPATATLNTASLVNIQAGDAFTPPANTTKAQAVQRAALMVVMNFTTSVANPAFSHNPPVTATWDAVPWNAMNKGNITQGFHGPNAMSAYIAENAATGVGTENSAAGHRRWMLRASATNFATGDIPGRYSYLNPSARKPPANVLYVVHNTGESATATPGFTPYPPAGFFPAPLNTKFWSLTYQGANFSAATVSVSVVGGGSVAAVKQPVQTGFGDPTLVWQMPVADSATSFPTDKTYSVTVSGISGTGVPTSHSYQVTLVNPENLTSNQTLTGTASPNPNFPAVYSLTPPPLAEALRVNTYKQSSSTWTEGAEPNTTDAITDGTDASYPLIFSGSPADPGFGAISSSRSFRLTHPIYYSPTLNATPEQSFQISRKVLPRANAALTFKYRRGYMAAPSHLAVEMTSDGGATWTTLGDIAGNNTNSFENSSTNVSYPLSASASPLSFRFRYYSTSSAVFAHEEFPDNATGILLDDITVTNCDFLEPRMTNELSAASTSFTLDSATRGGSMAVGEQWQLAMQTKLGNRWFPDGPLKTIVASSALPPTPYQQWVIDNPGLTGAFTEDDDLDGIRNGVEFAFFTNPLLKNTDPTEVVAPPEGSTVSIRRPLPSARAGAVYEAECSESLTSGWTSANVTVLVSGGFITATVPRPASGKCFMRWKISLP
jgi:hypothetical protein